ncbi:conserved hypothetical protein (plasmid) [Borreliella afzelii ACA-1]|uniref:transposase n=1 Tax=Borreliella afzelii TaxID=29518 RepID=UPI00016B3754|nr:conserved hypothetical protein [Borreliella afzelii ACA-1]
MLLASGGIERTNHLKFLFKNKNKLRKYQRKLSKKQEVAINKAKSRLRIVNLHNKVSN